MVVKRDEGGLYLPVREKVQGTTTSAYCSPVESSEELTEEACKEIKDNSHTAKPLEPHESLWL